MKRLGLSLAYAIFLCLTWAGMSWAFQEWLGGGWRPAYQEAFFAAFAGYMAGSADA
jgi:hypothetical protein